MKTTQSVKDNAVSHHAQKRFPQLIIEQTKVTPIYETQQKP
jgi:hypothetical protein